MERDGHETGPDRADLADLSALADGTLDPARRDEVRARIASSPELTSLYENEQLAVDALHELRAADRAPDELRRRLAPAAPKPRARASFSLRMPGMVAGLATVAVIVAALALLLPGGTPGSPSISQAAGLATLGSTAPAPPALSGARLNVDVQDVYFPDWSPRGWRAVGRRTDRIGGRTAQTVYYQGRGYRAAYTIVSAPSLKQPAASGAYTVNGTVLQTLSLNGRYVVTWRRSNHTCVLSVEGTPPPRLASALRELAASS